MKGVWHFWVKEMRLRSFSKENQLILKTGKLEFAFEYMFVCHYASQSVKHLYSVEMLV